jgi:hypothetical protein
MWNSMVGASFIRSRSGAGIVEHFRIDAVRIVGRLDQV